MEHTQKGYLNNDFRTCLAQLMQHGLVAHPRGTTTRELLNYNITLGDPRNRVILFPERKTSLKYLLGEFIWYIGGSNDPSGILPYAKFWDGIRNSGNQDGYQAGTINSNYGNRLFGKSNLSSFTTLNAEGEVVNVNQWLETIALLASDKDSRQAIMNIHVPSDRHAGNKDVPCTLTLHWFIREDKLHLIVNMRSNDVILGFTNDVFQFTMLQEAMCVQLRDVYPDLQLGHYFHNAGSMHIYDRHFLMAEAIIGSAQAVDPSMVPMDVFDDRIVSALQGVNTDWLAAGASPDFDFYANEHFTRLSPYWRTMVKFCFAEDEKAFNSIFGLHHEH